MRVLVEDTGVLSDALDVMSGVRREHTASHPYPEPSGWVCACGAEGGHDESRGQSGFWTHLDEMRIKALRARGLVLGELQEVSS